MNTTDATRDMFLIYQLEYDEDFGPPEQLYVSIINQQKVHYTVSKTRAHHFFKSEAIDIANELTEETKTTHCVVAVYDKSIVCEVINRMKDI